MNEEQNINNHPFIDKNTASDVRNSVIPQGNVISSPRSAETQARTPLHDKRYLPDGINLENYMGGISPDSIRSLNQSSGDKLLKGAGRVVTKTLTEFAKIPGFVGGVIAAMGAPEGEGWETAFNNKYIQGINALNEEINNGLLPVYKSNEYESLGLLSRLGTPEFWATEGADGLGYMLSAFGPGLLIKGMNLGAGIYRGVGKLGSMASEKSAYSILKSMAAAGIKPAAIDNAAITLANTWFEAGSEAGNGMDNFEKTKPEWVANYKQPKEEKLRNDVMSGVISDAEFEKQMIALEAEAEGAFKQQKGRLGRDLFWGNTAVLLGPNFIQTKLLFGNGAGNFIQNAGTRGLKETGKSFAKHAGKGVLAEGFFEEGMQSTIENMFTESAKKNKLTSNPFNDFNIGEIIENYADVLTSTEGQSAIFLGGLLGGTMNGYQGVKQDGRDYKNSLEIYSKLGNSIQTLLNDNTSIYKKDEAGNIIVDKQGNVTIDIQGSINAGLKGLKSEIVDQMYDNAKSANKVNLVRFIRDITTKDTAIEFAKYGETGREALNAYIDQSIEGIQQNEQLDDATRKIMLDEANRSKKNLIESFNEVTNIHEAYSAIEDRILPNLDEYFTGPQAEDEKANFELLSRHAFVRNRMFTNAVEKAYSNKEIELNRLREALYPKGNFRSLKELFNSDYTQQATEEIDRQDPKLQALRDDLTELDELHTSLNQEFRDKLSDPNYLFSEMEEYNNMLKQQKVKNAKMAEFEKLVDDITNSQTQDDVDAIKLPKELELFNNDFNIAKTKRKDEIAKKLARAKQTVKLNNNDETVIGTDVDLDNVSYSFNDTSEIDLDAGNDYSNSFDNISPLDFTAGFDILTDLETVTESESFVIENDFYVDSDNYVFANLEGLDAIDIVDIVNNEVIIDNNEIENELNHDIGEDVTEEQVSTESSIVDEEGYAVTQDDNEISTESTIPTTKDNLVKTVNTKIRNEQNGILNEDIPDDISNELDTEVNENDSLFSLSLSEISNESNVQHSVTLTDGNVIDFIVKLPRLTIRTATAVMDYLNNNKRKVGDIFNVTVFNEGNKYKLAEPALASYNKLRRIQKQNSNETLTTEDYENLLYSLPLEAHHSKNPEIRMGIDGVLGQTKISSHHITNNFIMRVQILNALLKDVDAPIKITVAKQFPGMLNINRNIDGKSIQSPISDMKFLKDAGSKENQTKLLQKALAYVNLERKVLGLHGDSMISMNAKTPGIIYIRVPNKSGEIKNIQVSRKKIEEFDIPENENDRLSKSHYLSLFIQNAIMYGNPYTTKIIDIINTFTDEDLQQFNPLFKKPLDILSRHHGGLENVSAYDFLNFHVHTSQNIKTKLNFQDGRVYVGSHIYKMIPQESNIVMKSSEGALFITAETLSSNEEAMSGLIGYLNLLKHNVSKTYASDLEYIEYLMDEVLITDIKPNEDAFVHNIDTIRRDSAGNIERFTNRYEENVFMNHIVDTGTLDRTLELPNEVIEKMPPHLRSLLSKSGLSEKATKVKPEQPNLSEITKTIAENQSSNLDSLNDTYNNPDTTIVPVSEKYESAPELTAEEQIELDIFEEFSNQDIDSKTDEELENEILNKLNETIQEDATIREYVGEATESIPSTTESAENIQDTSQELESITKATRADVINTFEKLDLDSQLETLLDVYQGDSSIIESFESEQEVVEFFKSIVNDIKDSIKLTNLKNKICKR